MLSTASLLSLYLLTQTPAWLNQHGTATDDFGTGITASCEGVYSVGYTDGAFDGNTSAGNTDAFLIKHNLAGVQQWSRQFGGTDNDYAMGIASFDLGGQCINPVLYVVGYTTGALGNGTTSAGNIDAFLTKFDKDGNRAWTRQLGTAVDDWATSVATDSAGNVYVAGYTTGPFSSASAGGQDFFVVKFDAAGTELWRRQLGSANHEQARGIACDANGNVYVSGQTFGHLDGNTNLAGNTLTSDIFLTKYNSAGLKQWTKQLGTVKSEQAKGLATSRRLDGIVDIYLVGHTVGTFANPNKVGTDYDGVLIKFNDMGLMQWGYQRGTPGNDFFHGVASDGGGNVYVTGHSSHDLNTQTDQGSDDIFMLSFTSDNTGGVVRQIGSTNLANPAARTDVGAGVAADKGAGVYVVGYTEGRFNASDTNAGGRDLIVLQYNEGCGVLSPTKCGLGVGWGDPHYVTYDGVSYDFQGYGEFILTEATTGDLVVQARQRPWNGSPYVSVISAIATRLGSDRVTFNLDLNPPFKVNGKPVAVTKDILLPGGGRILKQGAGYALVWPTGDHLLLSAPSNYIDTNLRLAPSRAGKMRGPLGNFNRNRNDDFALRTGPPLSPTLSFIQMYRSKSAYVNSWRISQRESLFDYESEQSTATFTNLDFPAQPAPPPTSTQQQWAQQNCLKAGVKDTAFLDACVTDLVLTGETGFAAGTAAIQANAQAQGIPAPAPAPRTIYLGEFEDDKTTGWSSSLRSATPTGERIFLGEFGNESVQLALDALPAHQKVILSFDLYVLNGWSGNTGPNRFGVRVSRGAQILDTTFSNTSRYLQSYPGSYPSSNKAGVGAMESGSLYYPSGDSVYRFKLTFDHTDKNLALLFSAQGLTGMTGEAWGLDNVEVQTQ